MPALSRQTWTLLLSFALVACASDRVTSPAQALAGDDPQDAANNANNASSDTGEGVDAVDDAPRDTSVDTPEADAEPMPDDVAQDGGQDAPVGCPPGLHDGGDGGCVEIGVCAGGYLLTGAGDCVAFDAGCPTGERLIYPDQDGDSFGDIEGAARCALEAPPGWSEAGTDCDDSDALRWRRVPLWSDADEDSYTALAPSPSCIGELPTGWREAQKLPPTPAFPPAQIVWTEVEEPPGWENTDRATLVDTSYAECDIPNNPLTSTCPPLVFRGFGLHLPDGANVHGVEVIVHRRGDGNLSIRDESVALIAPGGARSLEFAAPELWTNLWVAATYGGPAERWGLPLTAADLNSPELSVELRVSAVDPARRSRARIDAVELRVYHDGAGDCDDQDPHRYSTVAAYTDQDNDGFGSAPVTLCLGEALPMGVQPTSTDCDDTTSAVNPGITRYEDNPAPNGGFDYNCNMIEEPRAILSDEACNTSCAPSLRSEIVPAPCGESNSVRRCSGDSTACTRPTVNVRTSCR